MVYVTTKQSPMYHQMTLEELLFQDSPQSLISTNETNTRTILQEIQETEELKQYVDGLITKLRVFNSQTEALRGKPRHDLYKSFSIPKKSGGLRRIDAPEQELMNALRTLKTIFEQDFHAMYHTSAFAYIKHRSIMDCMKRHQQNESNWYGKYDLSNFFGSTTMEFVMHMFSMVFPFSEVVKNPRGKAELEKALELAFLDGGLPQGTPISPLITNIMMIPIDHRLFNDFRAFDHQRFVYTRYADDFQISSRYNFNFRDVERHISEVLCEFGAPFQINAKKTHYGSRAGQNWNLGLMLNKDNEITVGHKKKRQFQAMLSSYILDKRNGVQWDKSDIQTMEGYRNYYRMVEGETIDRIIVHINTKFNVNVVDMIKADLRP